VTSSQPRQRRPVPAASARVARARPTARARLKQQIARQAKRLGASVVGFAPASRWVEAGEVPEGYRPGDIWPRVRTVIAFGVPMLLPVVESTPSINHQELYDTTNRLLDDVGYRLSVYLNDRGHAAICLPRDGYGSLEILLERQVASFSHVFAAKYAGLGTVGLSHNLLVPAYGPRIRLSSVFTSLELEGDPSPAAELCNGCRLCERLCPAEALSALPGAILGALDKEACTRHHITLRDEKRWPCGVCIKVCPVGADRRLYESVQTKPYLDERSALAKDPADPRYRGLVHLRRHGSGGDRIA